MNPDQIAQIVGLVAQTVQSASAPASPSLPCAIRWLLPPMPLRLPLLRTLPLLLSPNYI